MNRRFFSGFSGSRSSFLLMVMLHTAVLAAVLVLRTSLLLFRTTGVFFWKVLYQRGLPPVIAGSAVCVLVNAAILFRRRTSLGRALRESRKEFTVIGILTLIGTAAALLISKTRLGLEKENAFYGEPTVPLLEWHILLAFLICLIWFCASKFSGDRIPKAAGRMLPVLIWLCAVVIWTAIPIQDGFFSPAGRAPNYETYPFSDGSFYGHYARAAAAGMGLKGNDIPPRPLYIAFLTGLHLLADNRYEKIIFLQTLVLGLLPVFVFLCGRDLHSTEAGLAAAFLVILRETHAILSSPFGHNISTVKYFFSDIPTAMVCAAYIWLLIRWQKQGASSGKGAAYALAAGCALGAMVLIRTQSLFLVLLLPFPLIRACRCSRKQFLKQGLFFFAALAVCILPWLLRSYRITGKPVFDHPMTQTAEMARSYNFDHEDLSQLPGENDGAYTERMTAFIAASARKHFPEIARFVTVHFLNSEISGFRLFPLRDHLGDPNELLKSREPFWELLDSSDLNGYNLLFFGLSYLVWAVGIAGSHQRSPHAGWIPLAAILLFNFSTALGRYSAGRYLIPTDWIMMLYFAAGLAEILSLFYRFCGGEVRVSGDDLPGSPSVPVTLLFILLTAAAIPLCDRAIPQRFVQKSAEEVEELTGPLQMSCPAGDRLYLHAIGIYPRYYGPGEGEPESAKQGYAETDHGRLVFLTLAPGNFGTIEMPLPDPPEYFPDGTEVYFSACQEGPTSVAETLLIEKDGSVIRYRSGQ